MLNSLFRFLHTFTPQTLMMRAARSATQRSSQSAKTDQCDSYAALSVQLYPEKGEGRDGIREVHLSTALTPLADSLSFDSQKHVPF